MDENRTYTQEQVDSLINPLKAQVAELEQYRPKEKTDTEKALEQKAAELWQKEVGLTLKEHGLDAFADFIDATDTDGLTKQVESLKTILAKKGLDGSYKPSDHRNNDKYSLAEQKGDTTQMIAHKLSKFMFKN